MGQAQSASIPSKEEILKRTKGGSNLVNELFQWMIAQASIRDFYLMANPAQCKKYIMLTANVLNQVFYKIDVIPKEGPKGTIYFRKIDALNPQDKSDPLYKHREINCLRLSFLFVRIFQVFAALSLTILDVDPEMEQKLIGDISKLRQYESIPLFKQGGGSSVGPSLRVGSPEAALTHPTTTDQRGGAIDSKKLPSSFEPLRVSLAEVPLNPNYFKFSGTSIYINHTSRGSDGSLPIRYDYSVTKNSKKEQRTIEGRIFVERKGGEGITIQLYKLRQSSSNSSKDLEDISIHFYRRSIEDMYRDRRGRSISESLDDLFGKLARGEVGKLEEEEVSSFGKTKEKASASQFERDMGEVAEGLHTKTIVSAFTRSTPPKAHCIARALQLVSESGLQAQFPKEIYSHLCSTKFMVDSRSLPPANERVTKEDGIYALSQLFYDTLREATPIISQKTQEQYKDFVTKMKFVFEETKDAKVAFSNIKRNPLDTVINKIPSGICSTGMVDKTLKTSNREMIRQLRDNVRKMVMYQINHTANVTKILSKLFLLPIESGKSLQIHPRVLKNGMDEVNALAEEARNLLVEYYSQCEILYRSGAEIIAGNKNVMTTM